MNPGAKKTLGQISITLLIVIVTTLILGVGYSVGFMAGQGTGYEQCRKDTVFPTRGEILNLTEKMEAQNGTHDG